MNTPPTYDQLLQENTRLRAYEAKAHDKMRRLDEYIKQETERCLQAVRDEPEYPGEAPPGLLPALRNLIDGDIALGTTNMVDVIRKIVTDTKKGIEERINATTPAPTNGDENAKT